MSISAPVAAPPAASPATTAAPPGTSRMHALFVAYGQRVIARAHRLFLWLLVGQWVAALVLALLFPSPAAWPLAAVGGSVFAGLAIALIRWRPFTFASRCGVALAQIGFCALFVQLTAGRLEMYFCFFVAIAFLSLYRDWRVLVIAAAVAISHLMLTPLWQSDAALSQAAPSSWSGAEFNLWLLLETAVLIWAGLAGRREMRETCRAQEQHQLLLEELEQRVRDRTKHLEAETAERERTAQALRQNEERHRNLLARLPIGVFETTRSGVVRYANSFLLGMVGLPAHFDPTIISLADGRIFPTVDRERFWHRLENEHEVRGFATTLRHFDGTIFHVVINARLKNAPGEPELMAEGTVEDVSVRKRAERELDVLHGQLMLASRQAGMAEVATGVLHNVGNVLTSVNLIVHDVQDRLKGTRLTHLHRVVEMLQREQPRLAEFLAQDPAGQKLPDFLAKLDEHLAAENRQLLTDVDGLVRHFEHIREIIVTQQGSTKLFGVLESIPPAQLFEDALRLNAESLDRHGIALDRLFEPTASVKADRHKVLQILVNLLKNAKDALQVIKPGERQIRVKVAAVRDDRIALSVEDNGPGIAPENLTKIFQHGFTTKPSGHGYGLHASVLAAREMGGDLTAESPGAGLGATFTLTLPVAKPAP
ncbi:ATP-binding protein [Opitutus terrae]|uniref:histidine kinase n=1 Tax=Opitutus terrae (strain DSM 11246 / JCM 15787 / PB90-1) TaxID=452637 RepID=B1ZVL4_OPITP|nr:ATP-binding protein [Opitutus terrae]ACB74111.1 multi-sensor signal transduction histidine kinase [Opitutus terrae PB90-1]